MDFSRDYFLVADFRSTILEDHMEKQSSSSHWIQYIEKVFVCGYGWSYRNDCSFNWLSLLFPKVKELIVVDTSDFPASPAVEGLEFDNMIPYSAEELDIQGVCNGTGLVREFAESKFATRGVELPALKFAKWFDDEELEEYSMVE